MTKSNKARLHERLLGASALSAILAVTMPVAVANAQDAAAEEFEEVVVTGSRIKRADIESVSPVSVVGSVDLNLAGNINIEQTLNRLPALIPNQTSTTNNGGNGQARVDLRELGVTRTLVLMNGRRMVGTGTNGAVDINNIPAALIERVEVLTGGASAIYGSDAVAGVVNFVMKSNFEGVEFGGQYNISELGDGDTWTTSFTAGGNFADGRGNIVFSSSYTQRSELFQSDRDSWAGQTIADFGTGEFIAFGSSNIPGSRVTGVGAGPNGEIVLPDGSFAVDGVGFTPDGKPISNNGNRYNFAPYQFIQTPQKRFTLNTLGHYEISDSVEVYWEGQFSQNRVDMQLAPNAGRLPSVGPLTFSADNPLLDPVTRQFFLDNFDLGGAVDAVAGDGIITLPTVNRRFTEGGPRENIRDLNFYRAALGFRGDLGNGWDYDVSYVHGRANRTDVLTNRVSAVRIADGLNSTLDANGNPVCISGSPGCVPLSIFGDGAVSDAAAAWISPTAIRNFYTQQNIVSASVSGTVDNFDLGAGALGLAVGVEYRKESAEDNPDSLIRSGELGAGNNASPTKGSYNVKELFAEAVMPLLADKEFAQRLDLELAGRISDYSTAGGVFSWSAGLQYEPVAGVRFRGGFQRATRAPNIGELYGGTSSGASSTTDPCSSTQVQPEEVAFCQQWGVANPNSYTPPNAQIFTTSGSNPNLFEETAETYTIGVVLTPEEVPGLEVTVDYYDIKLEDAITTLTSSTVLDLCLFSRDLNDRFCQAAQRDSLGDIQQIFAPNDNIANQRRKGIDWMVNYSFELGEGQLTVTNSGNYMITNEFQSTPITPVTDCNGIFGGQCTGLGDFTAPEWRMNQTFSYAIGDWYLRASGRLIGKIKNDTLVQDPTALVAQEEIKVNAYVDLSFTYQLNDHVQLTGGAQNITNNKPPRIGYFQNVAANTDPSLYDVIGRSYFMGAKVTF
ncbi:TonB-dependent receptor [Kordiimonas sediminis]|uniref:TonB-dependent receptor n=1 Tax=Kordiimonas sediminis TaxID=1735581 RepID=A0A919E639_9PROT|nr:TonB-dependent receptor [Kordiimonas sediminis]GHF16057.1 TonB-dependent receptor [Kordiimonas sediminis]